MADLPAPAEPSDDHDSHEITSRDLVPAAPIQAEEHPVAVYLAGLSPSSRRTMMGALEAIARLGMGERATAWDMPWHRLRLPHTPALRSALADGYAHTTANRMLSALRGVLKAAWKLGLMSGEEYQKATSVASVRGEQGGEWVVIPSSAVAAPAPDAQVSDFLVSLGGFWRPLYLVQGARSFSRN